VSISIDDEIGIKTIFFLTDWFIIIRYCNYIIILFDILVRSKCDIYLGILLQYLYFIIKERLLNIYNLYMGLISKFNRITYKLQ